MLGFLSLVSVFLVVKVCDGINEQSIKVVLGTVYSKGQDDPRSRQQLFLSKLWPEISALIPESVKIPGFQGNVDMNDYVYATQTDIFPNMNNIIESHFRKTDCEKCILAVFNAELSFKNPVNFVIQIEDSLGRKTKSAKVNYTFKGQNTVKFWLKIPDFSETQDKIPLECIVYIDSFQIESLSEPTTDESKLKDNDVKKMVKEFRDTLKQGDIQNMMRFGIMKALRDKLYPDTQKLIKRFYSKQKRWACLTDHFMYNVAKEAQAYSNAEEDEESDEDEFQMQIESRHVQKHEDMLYEKITISEFMDAYQRAIQHSIKPLLSESKRDICNDDFDIFDQISFTSDMAGMKQGQPNFVFIIYTPDVFRHLREFFGFTDDDFIESFCRVPLTELLNPGKSGSGLYLSQDQYFIAKTVQNAEADFLLKFLPGYFNNIHQNRDTLLPKFFGFYQYEQSVKIKLRFIVMNNLMPSNIKIDRKYDLKGSTFQREVSEEKRNKPSVTFKDLDFLNDHKQGLYLKESDHKRLMKSIEIDCTVLKAFQVVDYSLLLGIHYEDGLKNDGKVPFTDENSLPCETKDLSTGVDENLHNGIPAWTANGEKLLLFVGIIDILQSYRLKKRLEHYFKSVVLPGKEFSVVSPEYYGIRFKTFMDQKVFKKMSPCLTR